MASASYSRHTPRVNDSVSTIKPCLNKAIRETGKFHAYTVNKVQSFLSELCSDLSKNKDTGSRTIANRIISRITTSSKLIIIGKIFISIAKAIAIFVALVTVVAALTVVPVTILISCILSLGLLGLPVGIFAAAAEIFLVSVVLHGVDEHNSTKDSPCSDLEATNRDTVRHKKLENSQLIRTITKLRQCLVPHNPTREINKDDLLKLTIELFNLRFLSDLEPYQEARDNLIQWLKNMHNVDSLLQLAREKDREMLNTLQHSLSKPGALSIDKLEQLFELITEPCPLGKGHYDDALTTLQSTLFTKLISEQIPLLLANEFAVPLETVDGPDDAYNLSMHGKEEIISRIQNDIDKLHHISIVMQLLDILSNREKIKPTLSEQDHCNIKQCLEFYEQSRKEVMSCPQVKTNKCDDDTAAPKTSLWAFRPLARCINRSWLANQPHSTKKIDGNSLFDMRCLVSHETLDEIAPSSEMADDIVLLATDGYVYKSDALIEFVTSNGHVPFGFKSPVIDEQSHLVDIVSAPLIVPMKNFAVQNLLPQKSKLVPRLLRSKVDVSSKASSRPFWGGGAHHMKG